MKNILLLHFIGPGYISVLINDQILGLASAIAKRARIPHFITVWQPIEPDYFNKTDSYTHNIFPHPNMYSKAIMEIVKSFQWPRFAYIYDADENLAKLQETFNEFARIDNSDKQYVQFYKLPSDSDDYKMLLKSISKSNINRIMIDCTLEHTYSILKQTANVDMMNEYYVSLFSIFKLHSRSIFRKLKIFSSKLNTIFLFQSYFIAATDGHTLDIKSIIDKSMNITTIRLVNPELVNDVRTDTQKYNDRTQSNPYKKIGEEFPDLMIVSNLIISGFPI